MGELKKITKKIIDFRNARNWKQFHNPKDLALSMVLEAGEVMEHFQWKNEEEMNRYVVKNKIEIGEEIADVLYWVLLMSYDLKIDILYALEEKMKKNVKKYPIKKSKGKNLKYNKL